MKPTETGRSLKTKPKSGGKAQNTNLTNIGQILLICFLFIMILLQTAKIMSDSRNFTGVDANLQVKDSQKANINANPTKSADNLNINADNIKNAGNPANFNLQKMKLRRKP